MNCNWRHMTQQYASNDIRHFGLQGLLSACVGGIVYLYVAFCAWAGSISTGSVVRYAGAVWQFIQAATDLSASWNRLHNDRMQMDEYLEYLDLKNEMKRGTIPVEKRKDGRFLVEFRNVSFRYPESERYALRNLNVRLNIGECMALVGRNGSGKTTFVKLLCRLYDPTEGTILLNGVDISKYNVQEYRRLFSVVFQDFQIFSFSLGENIAGSTCVDEEKAMDAIRRIGLEGLYRKMPKGLHTRLRRLQWREPFTRMHPLSFWTNRPLPWIPSRKTRSIRASMKSSETKQPCSFPIVCPPAVLPRKSWCLKTETWFSREATIRL